MCVLWVVNGGKDRIFDADVNNQFIRPKESTQKLKVTLHNQ